MDGLDELGHFLARARIQYRDSLSEKVQELSGLLDHLESGSAASADQELLFDIVHRISGTAGSFGMDALGRVADEWEQKLRSLRGKLAGPSDCLEMRNLLEKLKTVLKAEYPPD